MARILLILLAAVVVVMLAFFVIHLLYVGFLLAAALFIAFGMFRIGRWSARDRRR
jgi:hypothetical protein